MSRVKMKRRTKFARVFKQCTNKENIDKVAVFDVDKDEIDYVNIDDPGSSRGRSKWSKEQQKESSVEKFINIDDDEGDIDLNTKNVAFSPTSGDFHQPSTSYCAFVDIEDDECQMLFDRGKEPVDFANDLKHSNSNSSRIFPSVKSFCSTQRTYYEYGTSESDMYISDSSVEEFSESDNSDCEIIDDSFGIKSWERAAKKRRKQDSSTDSESNSTLSGSMDESAVPFSEKVSENHTSHPSFCQKESADASNLKYAEAQSAFTAFKEKPSFEQMEAFDASSDDISAQGDKAAPTFSDVKDANCQIHTRQQKDNADNFTTSTGKGLVGPVSENEISLIGEREKHKESEEFKRAAEAEWASRQEQLRIQAEEVQRLRKRKKAENLRLLEMEKRQKQRLEEIRESQKKVEETVNLKEKIRSDIRKELARMELLYNDMASLLRALGVTVDGGHFPSTQEIHAAYKRAALKFHPDRASRSDLRQQVEAEEKFKLISRLKEKLLTVEW